MSGWACRPDRPVTIRDVDAVGATSRLTAAARARESARADRLFDDPWAAELAGEKGFSLLEGNDASLSGQAPPAFVVRHRFFDDFLTHQASQGIRQVVLIAAGLDTRAFRLLWPAGVRLFELDQAAVLSYKQHVLDNAGAAASCHRHIVPVDLRDDWPSALTDAGYRRTERTAWLAEGLLFYLPEATVTALLDAMAALSVAGSTLGTDTMSAATLGHPSRQAWVSYYASVGAPFIFGTDDPGELLARHGWRPTLHPYPDVAHQYGRSWLVPALPGPKNTLVTATRDPNGPT
jgi:methyltransferase (TIGR00027 family)